MDRGGRRAGSCDVGRDGSLIAAYLEAKERADADARDVELRLCLVVGGRTGNTVAQKKRVSAESAGMRRGGEDGGLVVNRIADQRGERREGRGEGDHAGTSY